MLSKAESHTQRTIWETGNFKDESRERTQLVTEAIKDGVYQVVPLVSNMKTVPINQTQFIQSILDRMKSTLCSGSYSENAQLFLFYRNIF
jgi:hypothetical protein